MEVDEICIISVKSAVRRRDSMQYFLPDGVNWYITIRDPVDGKRGCWESHRSVINDAKKRGVKRILIFEDDAYCRKPWDEVVKLTNKALNRLPKDWGIFMLGYIPMKTRKLTEDIYMSKKSVCMHAYIVNLENIDYIPPWWVDSKHIDWYLMGLKSTYPTYLIFPCLFFQRGENTFIDKSYLKSNKEKYDKEGFIDTLTEKADSFDLSPLALYAPLVTCFILLSIFTFTISQNEENVNYRVKIVLFSGVCLLVAIILAIICTVAILTAYYN